MYSTKRETKTDTKGVKTGKFFATSELLELVKYRAWLVKVTNAIGLHWQRQNARKKIFVLDKVKEDE